MSKIKSDNKENNSKVKFIKSRIVVIILLLVVILSGTFAWITYQTRQSALVLTIGDINRTRVTITPYHINEVMDPGGSVNSYIDINSSEECTDIYFYYKINEFSENIELRYQVSEFVDNDPGYPEGYYEHLESGGLNFEDINEDVIEIFRTSWGNGGTKYRVKLSLPNEYDQSELQGLSLDMELNASINYCDGPSSEPSAPVLDSGMIPVTIANDGAVTTISEDDSNWYDYSSKKWANVVLVDSDSRSAYLNTSGVTVNQDDILAYYVWIPRYKYQIWTTDPVVYPSLQTINIKFENQDDPISTGKLVGQYKTHPAFIWNGKTIPGFWVGKFEPSTDPTSDCFKSPTSSVCNNTDHLPRILPNKTSLIEQYIGYQFKTALKFANGTMSDTDGTVTFAVDANNMYGLNTTTNTTNSHMMKNSEWGAVAYLSHSTYGINEEIRLNNNSTHITGCGASTVDAEASITCEIKYGNATAYPQSTTGNIYGIFDMAGGSLDMVMGKWENQAETYFEVLPESIYYDLYSDSQFTGGSGNGTGSPNIDFCTVETCGGHALYETRIWYGDRASFLVVERQWFTRGGYYSDTSYAGIFNYRSRNGNRGSYTSWRSVLILNV